MCSIRAGGAGLLESHSLLVWTTPQSLGTSAVEGMGGARIHSFYLVHATEPKCKRIDLWVADQPVLPAAPSLLKVLQSGMATIPKAPGQPLSVSHPSCYLFRQPCS